MSECAKFRCWQRWHRTRGRGSRNFPTPTSLGSRHRWPHRNLAQLFLQCSKRGADPKTVDFNRVDENYKRRDEPHSRMDEWQSRWARIRTRVLCRIKKTFDVPLSSSASLKIVSHVWVEGLKRAGLGKRWGPTACWKWGSWFSTWVQRGMKFTPCTDGHHLL